MSRKMYVFRVTGGDPFTMRVKGNPPLRHDGGADCILRALCSSQEAGEIEKFIESNGCRVSVHCTQEDVQQQTMRQNVLSVVGGDRPFPSDKCPSCAWMDPHIESLCGAGLAFGRPGWDEPSIQGSLTNEKHRQDFESCPIRKVEVH